MNKVNYTCGFAFENDKVLLIQKEQPTWQAKRLNGIGGKIESSDITIFHAQAREFQEETGIDNTPEHWDLFDIEEFEDARIYWFWAQTLKIHTAVQTTNELPIVCKIRDVINDLDSVYALYNVPYLVSKAQCFRRNYSKPRPFLHG